MDWFERLTGFREGDYAATRARLAAEDGRLRSLENGRSWAVGTLELVSLAELRARARDVAVPGLLTLGIAQGDVRRMHSDPRNARALFQVASQFNLLEMIAPGISPEDGVTRYELDRTQGPACAVAAGAGTIWRNYFAPVRGGIGQTRDRQLDGLADLGGAIAEALGVADGSLWRMQNGYALPSEDSLGRIGQYLRVQPEAEIDRLRGLLRVGLHSDVEVTDGDLPGPTVSQIYCSALPVAYGVGPASRWAELARLVLEAAYEATLLAGVLNAARGASDRVLLTRLGGGAFGNDDAWIDGAMVRALRLVRVRDLAVEIVSRDSPSPDLEKLVADFGKETGSAGPPEGAEDDIGPSRAAAERGPSAPPDRGCPQDGTEVT